MVPESTNRIIFRGWQDLNDGGQLLMWGANDVGQCGLPAKKPIDIASPTEAVFESGGNSRNFGCFFETY
jgi:hypothetical protein